MSTSSSDPLELADEGLAELKSTDDWDEVTARTTLPELHVHLPQPSHPDLEQQDRRPLVRFVLSAAAAIGALGALGKAIADWWHR